MSIVTVRGISKRVSLPFVRLYASITTWYAKNSQFRIFATTSLVLHKTFSLILDGIAVVLETSFELRQHPRCKLKRKVRNTEGKPRALQNQQIAKVANRIDHVSVSSCGSYACVSEVRDAILRRILEIDAPRVSPVRNDSSGSWCNEVIPFFQQAVCFFFRFDPQSTRHLPRYWRDRTSNPLDTPFPFPSFSTTPSTPLDKLPKTLLSFLICNGAVSPS